MEGMDLRSEPLTAEAYAPFGDVVAASPRGEAGKPANYGTARRFVEKQPLAYKWD